MSPVCRRQRYLNEVIVILFIAVLIQVLLAFDRSTIVLVRESPVAAFMKNVTLVLCMWVSWKTISLKAAQAAIVVPQSKARLLFRIMKLALAIYCGMFALRFILCFGVYQFIPMSFDLFNLVK